MPRGNIIQNVIVRSLNVFGNKNTCPPLESSRVAYLSLRANRNQSFPTHLNWHDVTKFVSIDFFFL